VGDVDGAGRTVASAGKDALSHGMGRTGSGDGVGWNSAGVLDSQAVVLHCVGMRLGSVVHEKAAFFTQKICRYNGLTVTEWYSL